MMQTSKVDVQNLPTCNPSARSNRICKFASKRKLTCLIYFTLITILIVVGSIVSFYVASKSLKKTAKSTSSSTVVNKQFVVTTVMTDARSLIKKDLLPLITPNDTIYGVYEAFMGYNSTIALPYTNGTGQYHSDESPSNACDGNIATKYVNFGRCAANTQICGCGSQTGLHIELKRSAPLVTGFQICTGDDYPGRDPILVTLEGSNHSGTDLLVGFSWSLIYVGDSDLKSDTGRRRCGTIQMFPNSNRYKNYRFLILSVRQVLDCAQYSELQLYGY
ncbi:unnamed protein product [Adineta ricciae]|uniref:Uncharacterized protein n=1 Tax=Adineta ricciae TaxID=249248 RepID=A0A814G8B8_ADIRI|nr:unnamed protein product [Adineta ricciae]CAF0990337.1 unnamed protein product [Adineta ricciae]